MSPVCTVLVSPGCEGYMAKTDWDVIVIGAGAAGLMAAINAAECGRRILVLEKNRKPGVKILMSGGTRCNITHATDNRGIVEAYGPPGSSCIPPWPRSAFRTPSTSSRRKASPPRSRRRARSSPSATRPPMCSTRCCAPGAQRGRLWRWKNPSCDLAACEAGFVLDTRREAASRRAGHPHHRRPILSRQRHHRRRLRASPPASAIPSFRRVPPWCR